MNTNNTPTPFELAQLAAMLNPNAKNVTDQMEAVSRAGRLWRFAEWEAKYLSRSPAELREAQQQLKELLAGIFTIPVDEWAARVEAYKGRREEIDSALGNTSFPATVVQQRLYPDRSHTKASRAKCVLALAEFAKNHQIPYFGAAIENEDQVRFIQHFVGGTDSIKGTDCRWLFEVRQRQLSENKKRIPPTIRGNLSGDGGASIQHKKRFKA